jgi:hypothetical protein
MQDGDALDPQTMAETYFPSIQGKGVGDSFDFDAEPGPHGGLMDLAYQETVNEMKRSG